MDRLTDKQLRDYTTYAWNDAMRDVADELLAYRAHGTVEEVAELLDYKQMKYTGPNAPDPLQIPRATWEHLNRHCDEVKAERDRLTAELMEAREVAKNALQCSDFISMNDRMARYREALEKLAGEKEEGNA